MKLSIIVPAYNAEKYIGRCLDSIYSQTFKDFECIVVADSCTDNTAEIARSYGADVYEAKVRNDGLSRNVGLDHCKGEWILFIDSDDYWLHEYVFQQLVDRINQTNANVICFGMVWKHVGVVGAISGRNGMLFPHCTNKCWKRSFIGGTRFPGIKPDSDAGFHERMMKMKPTIDIWDMPIYYYDFLRDGSYSLELKRTAEQAKNYWGIHNEIIETPHLRFSIIIPAYNAEDRFRRTLDSIKNQTFQNFELIIICDSCTDKTADIAREYTDKVCEVNFKHTGINRNYGLDIAQGEYVLFTDDDDWWLHEFAFEMIDRKLRETNPDILYFSFIYKNYKYINPEAGEHLPAFWNKVWRRDFIKNIRCSDGDTYMADVEFQDMALAKKPKIVDWDMPLYYYNYMRPGSMTSKRGW
jgi:glycosyltransferase involved in cell wall biosynthesis